MLIICFSPKYDWFLVAVSLFILCEVYIDRRWDIMTENVTDESNDIKLSSKTVGFACSVITPTICGYCCDIFDYQAVRAFGLVPLGAAMVLSHYVPKEKLD